MSGANLPSQTCPQTNNQQQQQPSTSSFGENRLSGANVKEMRDTSFNHCPHSEIEAMLKQICEGVPGISQNAYLISAYIESVVHFYRTFIKMNSNITERPLDLSNQRHAIRPEHYDTLRHAFNELLDHGTQAALRESILATKFLDTLCFVINSSNENGDNAPMSNAAETLKNVPSFFWTSLPSEIVERINLLLQSLREFGIKYQVLIEYFQRIPHFTPGITSLPPLLSAPATLMTTSTAFPLNSESLPPPPLTPAPSIPFHSSWNPSYPRYEHSKQTLPPLNMPLNSENGLFMLSLAAGSIYSQDHSLEIGPLKVDVSSPAETVTVPHAHSDIGPRMTDWNQWRPPPPPTPSPSTLATPVGRNRAQSVSSELNRAENLFDSSTNKWPVNNLMNESLFSQALSLSESATSFTTPNEIPLHNQSPSFQGHQSTFPPEHRGLLTADSQSPSTSSMATIDTTLTSTYQCSGQDKKLRPKSRQQQSKSQKQQEESPKIRRTSTPQAERQVIPDTLEKSSEVIDEVDGTASQNTLSISHTSKHPPPQGKFPVLSDLCDKLRILVIEDNKFRKATVFSYAEQNQESDSIPSSTTARSPHNRIWRIHLDPLGDSDGSKRRRCTESDFLAWELLQNSVLYVSPESPDQLVSGTRVCAIWSATLGNVYFPGRIADSPPIKSTNNETIFPIQFDDGDSTLVPLKSILLLPDDYKTPKGPCPLPSGRRRLRSLLMSPDSTSICPAEGSGKKSGIGCNKGRTEVPNLMPNGGSGDKPDILEPIKLSSKIAWTPIGEPLKTQYKGLDCYKAFQRNVDNLVVRLNDTVTFKAAQSSEVYLGMITQIYSTKKYVLKVTAQWLYSPSEIGQAGKSVANYKGAVFTSNHFDDNEAFCINDPVRVANSYSEFLTATAGRKRRKISTTSSTTGTNSTSASGKKRRRLRILDNSDEESNKSSSDEEFVDFDIPRYFIAGEYDFIEGRVVSWDKDLAKELHLSSSNNKSKV